MPFNRIPGEAMVCFDRKQPSQLFSSIKKEAMKMSAIDPSEQLYERILTKARTDRAFKKALVRNPRRAIEAEIGIRLPEDLDINVEEKSSDELALTLKEKGEGELTDSQAASVVAGTDGLSALSEEESLRLQLSMDRRSKFIQTLSNIMKKQEAAEGSVTQNLK
jgi:hypothetical protein